MPRYELEQVRSIALALPGVSERVSHGAPCFFVNNKKPLCYYHDNHRGDGRVSVWFPAAPGVQDLLVSPEEGKFFRPSQSASGTFKDWVGVYLDLGDVGQVDWHELAVLLGDAFGWVTGSR